MDKRKDESAECRVAVVETRESWAVMAPPNVVRGLDGEVVVPVDIVRVTASVHFASEKVNSLCGGWMTLAQRMLGFRQVCVWCEALSHRMFCTTRRRGLKFTRLTYLSL